MFNSRNPEYRRPTGAVPAGTSIHFKIKLERSLRCNAARLVIREDSATKPETGSLFWCGMNGDAEEWWECDYTVKGTGLYFYHFELDTVKGRKNLTRTLNGEGTIDLPGGHWQLTVYEPAYRTPGWLAGGIIYQIFPDRFYASGIPKEGVPEDRKIHEKWGDPPDWMPNEKGEVTNSDYFGGDLPGIEEKLDYLESIGVTCIYLNPIFEAHSNHRYNTANYDKIDPLLGTEEDFRRLCAKARRRGIRVMLDGVFSHTGSDSIYFNMENRYPSLGAYNSQDSEYYPWYDFHNWPELYESWWGFVTLPNLKETNPQYNEYINGENGIVRKWLRLGASGWRLDVADELPDEFIDNLRQAAKIEKGDALVLGEVWEDATTKSAYGQRRRYLLGRQLDSVMNYPFCDAILGFLRGAEAAEMMEVILEILENYPPQVTRLLMNHIGTHDTERAITRIVGEPMNGRGRHWQSEKKLSPEQREQGLRLMRVASFIQYTLPGVPCVYYGDEAGMEGYRDPFNRGCYPWGNEEIGLVQWYRRLGSMRAKCSCLTDGSFQYFHADHGCLAFLREDGEDVLLVAVNAREEKRYIQVPKEHMWHGATAFFGSLPDSHGSILLEPYGCVALYIEKEMEGGFWQSQR